MHTSESCGFFLKHKLNNLNFYTTATQFIIFFFLILTFLLGVLFFFTCFMSLVFGIFCWFFIYTHPANDCISVYVDFSSIKIGFPICPNFKDLHGGVSFPLTNSKLYFIFTTVWTKSQYSASDISFFNVSGAIKYISKKGVAFSCNLFII